MIRAIHKESGKIVTSFAIMKQLEWKDKEKDIFIAPKPEIGNWKELKEKGIDEVEVSFIKQHIRKYNNEEDPTIVIPHFRIKTKEAIENPLNESEEHKLTKEGIYLEILQGNLIINGKKISEFEIIDADIEQRLSPTKKSVIADVYCKFKKRDEIFGEGIVFEIQFSSQNKERTEERTYDRILQGYSVCWLWEGDFKNNKLKNNSLEVIPYSKAIKEYLEKSKDEFRREIYTANNIYEEFKTKQENIYEQIKNERRKIVSFKNLISQEYSQTFQNILDKKIKDSLNMFKEFLDIKLKDVEKDFYNRNIDSIKQTLKEVMEEKIFFEVTNELKKVYEETIQKKLKEVGDEKSKS